MTNGTFRRVWRDFEAWQAAMADDACPDCLRLLLQGRIDYLAKPDPTHWKSGDVRELLLELAVTRMTDLCDLVGHGVDSLRSYLRFLDETGWLHPGSATMKVLRRELDRAASTYPKAMADTSRWRLAKRLYTAMRVAGVDLGDDDAIDTWVEAFNHRSPADRREVLGELLDGQPELGRARLVARDGLVAALAPGAPVPPRLQPDQADADDEPAGAYPPVVLADDHELAAAARASSLLRRVVTLARWVGAGRPVSRHGELIPPDARALADALGLSEGLAEAPGGWKVTSMRDVPPLTKAFYLAVETVLVAVRRSGILPGPRIGDCDRLDGPGGDEVALGLWEELFDLTARQAATPPADPQPPSESFSDWVGGLTPRALGMLYERQDAVDLNDLLATLASEHHPAGDHEESAEGAFLAVLVGLTVRGALAELADHGAVTVAGAGLPTSQLPAPATALEAIGVPPWVLVGTPGVTARLTPLGTWAVRRALLTEGAHAPATKANA
jgi:hypothetical protein